MMKMSFVGISRAAQSNFFKLMRILSFLPIRVICIMQIELNKVSLQFANHETMHSKPKEK
jgi:hypothetical protein